MDGKKKKILLFFTALLLAGLLSGCGKKQAGQWEPQEFDLPKPAADQGVQVLPADDATQSGAQEVQ